MPLIKMQLVHKIKIIFFFLPPFPGLSLTENTCSKIKVTALFKALWPFLISSNFKEDFTPRTFEERPTFSSLCKPCYQG